VDDAAANRLFMPRGGSGIHLLGSGVEMNAANPRKHSSQTSAKRPAWVRALGRTLSGILVLGALVLSWFMYKIYYANPRTDDAYVHANTASVAAHVSGPIIKLPIKDNQQVKTGDLLFVVDPRPYKLALDTARTKLNLTEIEVETLHDTINSPNAQLAQQRIDAANAKQYLDRIVPLRQHDFVTDNDVVEARNKYRAAAAGVRTAASELEKAQTRWESSAVLTSDFERRRKRLMTPSSTTITASCGPHSTAMSQTSISPRANTLTSASPFSFS
jgi:multidrug resistance efflux pump